MTHNQLIQLLSLSLIKITGTKQDAFLQGQLTCDIRDITPAQSRLAAHCNAKGRVLATMRVINFQESFYLLLPRNMLELTLKGLGKFAPFSRVMLAEEPALTLIGCYGENITTHLTAILGNLPQQPDQVTRGEGWLCTRIHGSEPRFILMGMPIAIHALQQKLTPHCTVLTDDISWRLLDIQNGIANIYPETMNLFTPHMLNYPQLNAVSFTKGCYVGQEIIARTHYLGKAKRHLQLMTLDTEKLYHPGEILYNDKQQEIGIVIDAIHSSSRECQLLAVIHLLSLPA